MGFLIFFVPFLLERVDLNSSELIVSLQSLEIKGLSLTDGPVLMLLNNFCQGIKFFSDQIYLFGKKLTFS